jgi:CBS domain-containing protein
MRVFASEFERIASTRRIALKVARGLHWCLPRCQEVIMRVQDVMTRQVKTVKRDTPADQAWSVMRVAGIHHLVVVDEGGAVGVFSDRDAGGRRGDALRKGHTVEELMSSPAITIEATATARQAANRMRGRSIGCLVVTDDRAIIGIVTTADLLTLLGVGAERPLTTAHRWTLKHRAPHRKARSSAPVW